jgi:hypothetical protein
LRITGTPSTNIAGQFKILKETRSGPNILDDLQKTGVFSPAGGSSRSPGHVLINCTRLENSAFNSRPFYPLNSVKQVAFPEFLPHELINDFPSVKN